MGKLGLKYNTIITNYNSPLMQLTSWNHRRIDHKIHWVRTVMPINCNHQIAISFTFTIKLCCVVTFSFVLNILCCTFICVIFFIVHVDCWFNVWLVELPVYTPLFHRLLSATPLTCWCVTNEVFCQNPERSYLECLSGKCQSASVFRQCFCWNRACA